MKEKEVIPPSTNIQSNLFAFFITILALIGIISLESKPFLQVQPKPSTKNAKEIEVQWSIQPEPKKIKNNKKFVEANPNSPINPPDDTNNFSFREQQAAQPDKKTDEAKDDIPKLDGVEFSSKVAQPSNASPALKKLPDIQDPTKEKVQNEQKKKSLAKVTPKSMKEPVSQRIENDGLKIEKQDKEGEDKLINLSKNQTDLESKLDKSELASLTAPKVSSIATRPRPRLSPELLRGPIMKTISNAPRVGMLAVECRLHPYGVYVQEMLRSIEDQWHQLAHGSMHFLQKDKMKAKITYRFTLQADGKINDLQFLGQGDGALPAELCRQAIASRVPFGEWTQKMIDDFGQSDEITIHFNYR